MGRSRRVIRWKTDCLQTSRRIYFFSNNPNPPSQISPLAPSFIRHRLPWSTLLVLKPLRALQGGESPVWGSPWWDVPSQMTEPGKGHPACPLAVLVVVSFRDQDLLPCKGPTQPRAPAPAARTSPAPCSSGPAAILGRGSLGETEAESQPGSRSHLVLLPVGHCHPAACFGARSGAVRASRVMIPPPQHPAGDRGPVRQSRAAVSMAAGRASRAIQIFIKNKSFPTC